MFYPTTMNANRSQEKPKLTELRLKKALTQLQLAVLVGVTPNTIQSWEKNGLPNLQKYRNLASILGCDLDELEAADKDSLFDPAELERKFAHESLTTEKLGGRK